MVTIFVIKIKMSFTVMIFFVTGIMLSVLMREKIVLFASKLIMLRVILMMVQTGPNFACIIDFFSLQMLEGFVVKAVIGTVKIIFLRA